jgi:hypothetical protein
VTSAKSLVFGEACGCIIVCQGKEAASSEESDRQLEALARYAEVTTKPRVLVISSGGAPTPEQRKELDQVIHPLRERIRIAVVTDSTFARGVVKAIRLLYPCYQAFALKELDDALRFLDVRSADVIEVKRCAEELRASLSG